MKAQHYKFKATLDHLQNARPGQFVFENNESDTVIGFVDFVSDSEIAFMMFEPKEIPDSGILISEECDYLIRLSEIFTEDPEIVDLWNN